MPIDLRKHEEEILRALACQYSMIAKELASVINLNGRQAIVTYIKNLLNWDLIRFIGPSNRPRYMCTEYGLWFVKNQLPPRDDLERFQRYMREASSPDLEKCYLERESVFRTTPTKDLDIDSTFISIVTNQNLRISSNSPRASWLYCNCYGQLLLSSEKTDNTAYLNKIKIFPIDPVSRLVDRKEHALFAKNGILEQLTNSGHLYNFPVLLEWKDQEDVRYSCLKISICPKKCFLGYQCIFSDFTDEHLFFLETKCKSLHPLVLRKLIRQRMADTGTNEEKINKTIEGLFSKEQFVIDDIPIVSMLESLVEKDSTIQFELSCNKKEIVVEGVFHLLQYALLFFVQTLSPYNIIVKNNSDNIEIQFNFGHTSNLDLQQLNNIFSIIRKAEPGDFEKFTGIDLAMMGIALSNGKIEFINNDKNSSVLLTLPYKIFRSVE